MVFLVYIQILKKTNLIGLKSKLIQNTILGFNVLLYDP